MLMMRLSRTSLGSIYLPLRSDLLMYLVSEWSENSDGS